MSPQTIYLACPTHNGMLDYRTARSIYQTASKDHNLFVQVMQGSLLAHTCNQMYVNALNKRVDHGITWFAMIHADIVPDPFWLDTLIEIAEAEGADMLSAIAPIKDSIGVTSTAIVQEKPYGCLARLTIKQVHALPETFDKHKLQHALQNEVPDNLKMPGFGSIRELLCNTGCMISRLDREWSDEVYFNISDKIKRLYNQYYADVEPEDWSFSRLIANRGGKVMATKAVNISHMGSNAYTTSNKWGHDIDPDALTLLNKQQS